MSRESYRGDRDDPNANGGPTRIPLILSACTTGEDTAGKERKPVQETGKWETVTQDLNVPWSVAYADGTFYLTERGGTLVHVRQSGGSKRVSIELKRANRATGEGGLLGLALAPDFATSQRAYIYHTYEENGRLFNRIVLIEWLEQSGKWIERKALLEGIPGGPNHNGGRLAIGPDRHLYATTGDAGEKKLAQDKKSLAGKILRLKLDGGIPADNPFPQSYVYTYGHRNPQGLAWNRAGQLLSSEHGPSGVPGGHDELNLIQPGKNYGWPEIIGDETKEGMVSPVAHSDSGTWAPSGMAVTPAGELFVAALRGERLLKVTPAQGYEVTTALEGLGRLRDAVAVQNELYILTNNTDGRGQPRAGDDRLVKVRL
ncbi:PQQ-dependent sugar dehydrogenase [Laceyella putida]|uniref:PQQ-dependent sugar dehydrogenase n=1 Tax=Laceyella putida TaxID=110101 RepID=A0ABW2RHB7_9BACL